AACVKQVDRALDRYLPKARITPSTVHKAMRHSMFAGGKRLRPVLAMAAAEASGGDPSAALPAACAVECIHTFSLIHDDLPCMDDDDLRRGKPTCHVVYGEAVALLAGDALQALAFEILAQAPKNRRYSAAHTVAELAVTSGSRQLVGGQVLDLEGEGNTKLTKQQLRAIHERKTAALLTTSLRLGAMAAGATPRRLDALTAFGKNLGLAFQVIDDILDVTATTEKLGKTAGKDQAVDKSTYPSVVGLEASRKEAGRLTRAATRALGPFGKSATRLHGLAAYLLDRDY
ncbi:MAG: polyprenyl synthetase family protein, partial [Verrucomicrobiales bacterium]|nr:polyprenyl synthetase family protein [Verrucomicrobiales bacterium]